MNRGALNRRRCSVGVFLFFAGAWACKGGDGGATNTGTNRVTGPDASADAGDAGFTDMDAATLTGQIVLPLGFDGGVASLRVVAQLGSSTPDGDGGFTVMGAGPGRQGVIVEDDAGNPVLVGWAIPDAGATISTASTAAFFLFLYTGAPFLPPSAWDSVANKVLDAGGEIASLAAFLDQKLAANPTYFATASAADKTEFAATVGGILKRIVPLGTPDAGADAGTGTGALSQPLVLVDPTQSKSGITVLIGDQAGQSNADVNQITFMNEWRRRAYVFIDRKVGETYVEDYSFELDPVNGLNGVFGSLVDVIYDNGAYTPKYYGPVGLGNVDSEDDVIRYRIRAVGYGQPTSVSLTKRQDDQRRFIEIKSMLADLYLPAFLSLMNFKFLGDLFGSSFFGEFVKEITNQAFNGGLIEVGNLITAGDIWGAIWKFGSVMQNNGSFREWFLEQFRILVMIKLVGNEEAWKFSLAFSKMLLFAIDIVDKMMAVIDYAKVASDGASANSVEDWEVLVRAPKVLITPGIAKLTCGEKTTFVVTVKNAGQTLSTNLEYEFSNTAAWGDLTTSVNSTYKNSFTITKGEADYTVKTGDIGPGGTDTIKVKVYVVTQDAKGKTVKQEIGKGEAKAEVSTECTNTGGVVGSGAFTSGCTGAFSVPSSVRPGETVTVTARAGYGGVCGTASVWMSYAVSARLDSGDEVTSGGSSGIYDFCYWGGPQPVVPSGVGVALPDGNTHTITFRINPDLKCPVCVKQVFNGTPCWSNSGNRQNISGPAVVMSGTGGTVGWSTVRFFTVEVPTP
ncbi:MAG: hypothetical protein HYY84_16525 [Deltaproteobacteria bacterium]|nr:hypothetical protein [Deltaproteobacteria bacterium]